MLMPAKKALKVEDIRKEMFIGVVEDREDPEQLGRLRIRVSALHGDKIPTEELPWAIPFTSPIFGSSQGAGFFSVPYLDSKVVVTFHRGDPYSPIYLAQTLSPGEIMQELLDNYGNRYGFSDATGNKFFVDEEQGIAQFTHKSGTVLEISDDGSVSVSVVQDETKSVAGNSSVTIDGNSEILVKGTSSFTCEKDVSIDAQEDVSMTVAGDVNCAVEGDVTASCASAALTSQGAADITCNSSTITAQAAVEVNSASAKLNCSGSVDVVSPKVDVQSTTVTLTASGAVSLVANTVTITSAVINLGEGATEPLILGNSFATWLQSTLMLWLNTHTHVSSAPGSPTSPPVLPMVPGAALPGGLIYSKFIRGK